MLPTHTCLAQWFTPFASFHLFFLMPHQAQEWHLQPEQKVPMALLIQSPHPEDVVLKEHQFPVDGSLDSSHYTQLLLQYSYSQWETTLHHHVHSDQHDEFYFKDLRVLQSLLETLPFAASFYHKIDTFCSTHQQYETLHSLLNPSTESSMPTLRL